MGHQDMLVTKACRISSISHKMARISGFSFAQKLRQENCPGLSSWQEQSREGFRGKEKKKKKKIQIFSSSSSCSSFVHGSQDLAHARQATVPAQIQLH
jgi:hypothetical protein